MATCRFCKEDIRADATVCPHCRRDVGVSAQAWAALITIGVFVLLVLGVWWISVTYR